MANELARRVGLVLSMNPDNIHRFMVDYLSITVIGRLETMLISQGFIVEWDFDMLVYMPGTQKNKELWYVDFLEPFATFHIDFYSSYNGIQTNDITYRNGLSIWYSDQTTIYELDCWHDFDPDNPYLPQEMEKLLEKIYGGNWKINAKLTFSVDRGQVKKFLYKVEKLS